MRFFDWFERKPQVVNLAHTLEESVRREFRAFWLLFFDRNTTIKKMKLQEVRAIIIDEFDKLNSISPQDIERIKWAKDFLQKHGYDVVDL